jgi:O-antigen/teichoic acid export membrane protein
VNDNTLIFKNTGILFFRLVLSSILALFSSRFIIRSLGVEDFGLYSVVGSVVVMMAFLNTVMTTTTYRFLAFEMGKAHEGEVNKVFNISMVIHLGLVMALILLTETLGVYYVLNYLKVDASRIPDALFVLRYSTYAMVFSILSIPFQGLVTAQERFDVTVGIEIVRSILKFVIALAIVYYLGNKLRMYAVLIAVVSIIPASLFFIYCKYSYSAIVKWNLQNDRSKYREMIEFSGWIMIGASASIGKTTGTALIINSFFGTLLNAAYGIANQVNSIVLMFAQNLGQAAIPQITKSFSGGNTDRTLTLVVYISKYTYFLMLLCALPILLDTEFLLTLWLGELPAYTVVFSQLMIANALIESLNSGIPAVVSASGKIKYFQIILSGISLLSLPIAYFLFKAGYPPSSILVAFISTAIMNVVIRQILLKYILKFNVVYFLKTSYLKALYVTLAIIPLFYTHYMFPVGMQRFILFSLVAIIWLLAAISLLGISTNEKQQLKQLIISGVKNIK